MLAFIKCQNIRAYYICQTIEYDVYNQSFNNYSPKATKTYGPPFVKVLFKTVLRYNQSRVLFEKSLFETRPNSRHLVFAKKVVMWYDLFS